VTAIANPRGPLARRRLLDLLGVGRYARRGRLRRGGDAPEGRPAPSRPVVVVGAGHTSHPLVRSVLAVMGVEANEVLVAGASVTEAARCLLAFGECGIGALVVAPAPDVLARDPGAKRALWRALRSHLRRT
jgi:hypothetical protein